MKVKLPKLKRLRLKYKKGLFALMVLAGVGYGLYRAYMYLSFPVEGTINAGVAGASVQKADEQTVQLTLKGKHFSIKYSSKLSNLSDTSKRNPGFLEQYQLMTSQQIGNDMLIVSVKDFPSGNLNSDGSYKLRITKKQEYTETKEFLADKHEVTFMQRNGTQEVVAFLPGNGKLATLSYKTTQPGGDALQEARAVMETFIWTN